MQARIDKLDCWVLRAPIKEAVANAFGAMTNRPAALCPALCHICARVKIFRRSSNDVFALLE